MLAVLLANCFAPLIDWCVVRTNIRRRAGDKPQKGLPQAHAAAADALYRRRRLGLDSDLSQRRGAAEAVGHGWSEAERAAGGNPHAVATHARGICEEQEGAGNKRQSAAG